MYFKCLDLTTLQTYKFTVVYNDGSKSVLQKKYEEFVDLQVSVMIAILIDVFFHLFDPFEKQIIHHIRILRVYWTGH